MGTVKPLLTTPEPVSGIARLKTEWYDASLFLTLVHISLCEACAILGGAFVQPGVGQHVRDNGQNVRHGGERGDARQNFRFDVRAIFAQTEPAFQALGQGGHSFFSFAAVHTVLGATNNGRGNHVCGQRLLKKNYRDNVFPSESKGTIGEGTVAKSITAE